MLLIKTYIAADRHGGTGLFSGENISQGAIIWRYHPEYTRYITAEEYAKADAEKRSVLTHFAYPVHMEMGGHNYSGLFLHTDNARFTNHSESPNVGLAHFSKDVHIALRPIMKGEEITCDYRAYDPENVIAQMGVASCKNFLLGRARQSLWERNKAA